MEELKVTEYRGMRVLTTQQIAEAYGVEAKKITDNFNNNKSRYVEGKHFICLDGEELKRFKSETENLGFARNLNKLYLWTKKGAFLHAKSLNTDTAWEVYDRLVDSYFDHSNLLDGMSPELKAALKEKDQIIEAQKAEIEELKAKEVAPVAVEADQEVESKDFFTQAVESKDKQALWILLNEKRTVADVAEWNKYLIKKNGSSVQFIDLMTVKGFDAFENVFDVRKAA